MTIKNLIFTMTFRFTVLEYMYMTTTETHTYIYVIVAITYMYMSYSNERIHAFHIVFNGLGFLYRLGELESVCVECYKV